MENPNSLQETDRQTGGIRRTPQWIESGSKRLWAWIHESIDSHTQRQAAVVIFNPLGHELIHTHRSIRRLADEIARAGFTALRVDYTGTGDSDGDQLDDVIVDQWLRDATAAVGYIKSKAGSDVVHLVGIRSGALIASACARHERTEGGLVLWDTCISGARFVRELKANSRLAYFVSRAEVLESVGFPYSPAMLRDLAKIDICELLNNYSNPILVVTRSDQPEESLTKRLSGSCSAVTCVDAEGLDQMLVEPHRTLIPEAAIKSVVKWLADLPCPKVARVVHLPFHGTSSPVQQHTSAEFVEYPVEIGPMKMFGMLCSPAFGNALQRPIILLGNAGSIYHIGPNRLYVNLSRRLAQAGFASIRYDLANIGEGLKDYHAEDNFPYPSDAVTWISDVIRFGTQDLGFSSVVLTGFCSGATQAFLAALAQGRSSSLAEIIMVNPKVFYGEHAGRDDDSLVMRRSSYYSRAIRDTKKWRRLVTGGIDYRQLSQFVSHRLRFLTKESERRLRGLIGFDSGTRLGNDITRLLKNGTRLSFFFSTRDPGLRVLLESSGGVAKRLIDRGEVVATTIEDGDHTLIAKRCRDDFIGRFVAQVSTTYK